MKSIILASTPSLRSRTFPGLLAALATLATPLSAHAQEGEAPATEPAPAVEPAAAAAEEEKAAEPAAEAPPADAPPPADAGPPPAVTPPKPPPYSLPFQLRPVAPGNVVRLDTAVAFWKIPKTEKSGSTVAPMLLASYKVTEEFAPLVRVGMVSNSPPDGVGKSATAFLNPVLGGLYGIKLSPELKLGLFLGLTLPIGSNGGNEPDPDTGAALGKGIAARSAMDNAMFAVNDFTVFPGVDFAYVSGGFTAQAEATVFQLTRVRGDKVQKDTAKTNFTTGVHVGYFFIPMLSAGVELRHQRWLKPPKLIKDDKTGLKDNTTVAIGPRLHFQLGEKMWLRPAIALALPIDKPLTDAKYKTVQIDIPFVF